MKILTLSCWSNSIHFRLFNKNDFALLALGSVERVGMGDSYMTHIIPGRQKQSIFVDYCDHYNAIEQILETFMDAKLGIMESTEEIVAVGHRVTHGGEHFSNSVIIDDQTFSTIRSLKRLAPLHHAYNITGIEVARELLPDIPQIAIFDTAFHQTMPEHAYIYALPYEWYVQYTVRRYGFHGHAHLYLSQRAAALLRKRPAECNLVTIYLDRGVSICALRNGISIDTSMGMTPLEGAVMGTRCGDIDPGIISFEMQRGNLSAQEMATVLNQKSGLLGITGQHYDRSQFIKKALEGNERCALALKIETHRLKKYIGSYCAAVGRLDAVVFSHGSGNYDWYVRQLTMEGMDIFGMQLDVKKNKTPVFSCREDIISQPGSPTSIFVIPSDEQLAFAEDVASILNEGSIDHVSHAYSFSLPSFVPNICTEDQEIFE